MARQNAKYSLDYGAFGGGCACVADAFAVIRESILGPTAIYTKQHESHPHGNAGNSKASLLLLAMLVDLGRASRLTKTSYL